MKLQIDATNLEQLQPNLRAADWRSPLVYRLLKSREYVEEPRCVNDTYVGRSGEKEDGIVEVIWSGLREDFRKCLNSYQEPVLTEFATLGLACILLRTRANMEITEVCRRGEKVDYWLGDRELLLEVGGLSAGNLEALSTEKKDQLLSNPFECDGYICVAVYASASAVVSFHTYEFGGPADGG